MHRRFHRLALAVVLLALALSPLASPALAAPARTPGVPIHSFDQGVRNLAMAFWDGLLTSFPPFQVTRSAWAKEGGMIDPNGAPHSASAPTPPSGENGGSVDPNGKP